MARIIGQKEPEMWFTCRFYDAKQALIGASK